jgi:hypothetical protein
MRPFKQKLHLLSSKHDLDRFFARFIIDCPTGASGTLLSIFLTGHSDTEKILRSFSGKAADGQRQLSFSWHGRRRIARPPSVLQ